MTTATVHR